MWFVPPRLAVTSCRCSPSSSHRLASSRCASHNTRSGNRQIDRLSSQVQSLPSTGRLLAKTTRRCYHHHQLSLAGGSSSSPPAVAAPHTHALADRWTDACGGARHRKRSLSTKAPNTTAAATAAEHNEVGSCTSPRTARGGVGVGTSSSVGAGSSPTPVDSAALLRRMATYIEEDAGAADKLGNAVSWLSLVVCCFGVQCV